MKKLLTASFVALSFAGMAQTAPAPAEKEWDASIYGFVRTDYIWDTRQSAQVREYHLNLYPLDEKLDANGKDVNATGASNFLSVVSRLGVKFRGPNVWGAKATGNLEGDFFGNTESSIGLLRLRHAYASLEWAKTTVTMGQTWYPTFIPEVFPGVANFSTGIMFNPFGWASQVKVKQNLSKEFSFTFTAYKEREFVAPGVTGQSQNSASINSAIPSLNGQFQYKGKNLFAGLGLEVKSMQPLIVSATNLVSDEKLNSTALFGYLKYNTDKFHIKAYGISGGNLNNLVMLGGFTGAVDANGIQTYSAVKTTSFWIDIASNGKSIAPGLFIGSSSNNGSSTAAGTAAQIYMRGLSGTRVVDNVYRVSGRVDFKQNKFRITPELEYTGATWGDADLFANATTNTKKVANFRAMVSCVYTF